MLIGAVAGIIVMVVLDHLTGKVVISIYATPMSVFLGALVAGYIATIRAWISGLVVGVVSSSITIGIYYYFSPQINADQLNNVVNAAIKIVSLNIICSVVGGHIGGHLGKHMNVKRTNVNA